MAKDPIMGDVSQEYRKVIERYRLLSSELHDSYDEARSIDDEEQHILDKLHAILAPLGNYPQMLMVDQALPPAGFALSRNIQLQRTCEVQLSTPVGQWA